MTQENGVHSNLIIQRGAGVILLLAGTALLGFGALAVKYQFESLARLDFETLVGMTVLFGLGSWFGWMGFRLAANRPNRHGSLLPPAGWYTFAFVVATSSAAALVGGATHRDATFISMACLVSIFAWWCWSAARNASRPGGATSDSTESVAFTNHPSSGYYRLFTIRGIPVLIHPSLPIGGVWFAVYGALDGGNFIYYCLGYLLLVGVHEAGHAVAARAFKIKVSAIEISGFGGLCRIEGLTNAWHAIVVYSAGIVAELVVLVAALLYVYIVGEPSTAIGKSLVKTFIFANAILLVFNLIPARLGSGTVTDGHMLKQLVLHLYRNHPNPLNRYVTKRADQSPVFPPDTQLLTMKSLVPTDFKQGVEILNDNTTPMEFVVSCLQGHLQMDYDESVNTMLTIHNNGGVLIALPWDRAQAAAEAITNDARQKGHALICRAVRRDELTV